MFKKSLLMAMTAILATSTVASAQNYAPPPGSDPYGYYSRYDGDGYYDRNGRYQRYDRGDRDRDDRFNPPPPPPSNYYREGYYEDNCRRSNNTQVAGTIFGALAGGLIGSAASRGNGTAVVGGAVLGGLLGNTLTRDIPCEDQPYAFRVYADGLNGRVGERYEWRRGGNYGYFTPIREFRRGGYVCRDFTTITYRGRERFERRGTACRWNDGNWHFD
jgi:surface antigen